jgi:MFS family permease
MLIAGRVVAGLAVGVLLSTVPVYNAEMAVPKHRGVVVGIFGVMVSFGVLCSNWVGYACQFTSGNAPWRIPLGCQIPVAFILCVGSFILPESPRVSQQHRRSLLNGQSNIIVQWLIKHDRSEEAYQSKDLQTRHTLRFVSDRYHSSGRNPRTLRRRKLR